MKVAITAIAVDPGDAFNLFVGFRRGFVLKTVNGGASWKSLKGLNPGQVTAIVFHTIHSNVLYLSTLRHVYKSTNAGENWFVLSKGLPGKLSFNFVAVDPSNPQTVYAGGPAGVFISTDEGVSWSGFDSNGLGPFTMNDLLINSTSGLILGTDRGVFSFGRAVSADAPFVEQLSPASGKVGDTININGRNFGSTGASSQILFGSVVAGTTQSWSDDRIAVNVPSGAQTGPVTVTVASRKSNPYQFAVISTTPGNVEPGSGPSAGGTKVTIIAPEGISNQIFFNVLFGSTLAKDIGFTPPNVITCTSPPGNGTVEVSISTSALVTSVGTFTYQ